VAGPAARPPGALTPPDAAEARAPIRVVHLGTDPESPGGMSAVIRGVIASDLAERHRLEVIPTYRPLDPSYKNVDPVKRMTLFLGALLSLARWCLGRGRRVVHVHAAVRGSFYRKAIVVLLAKALRRPAILHIHGGAGDIGAFADRIGGPRRKLIGFAFRAADRVICVSAMSAEAVRERFGVRDVMVVPNPAPSFKAPDRNGDRPEGVGVLYLGGFANPVKGGEVMLEALPRLVSASPDARFVLAGPGDPPPALADLIERLPAIEWAGWLDEQAKARALADCDVFLLPSLSEGLPVALLEAMAAGKAVVATRVGGIPDAVRDGVDGVLIEPGDVDAVCAAVGRLVADRDERERLGRAAQETVASSQAAFCDRLDAVYRELAA
jgi:glycosyltransferase involved in cell wall biosynthesis